MIKFISEIINYVEFINNNKNNNNNTNLLLKLKYYYIIDSHIYLK